MANLFMLSIKSTDMIIVVALSATGSLSIPVPTIRVEGITKSIVNPIALTIPVIVNLPGRDQAGVSASASKSL